MGIESIKLTNFKQVIDDMMRGADGSTFIPSLQSDYTIVIVPEYESQTNSSKYQNVILTNINLSMLSNGFRRTQNKMGFQTTDFSFTQGFDFGFIGIPYFDEKTQKTFTSLIHYYYNQQLTKYGTFRIKTRAWKQPTIYIVNMHSNHIVYKVHNCTFTYPTFSVSPSSNDIIIYKTNVSFGSYEEYLFDDYMHTNNLQQQ